jgi:hypothetical protein
MNEKPILLITPPLVQTNAPYPAVSVLSASLRARGFVTVQEDVSLALVLRLFASDFLTRALAHLRRKAPAPSKRPPPSVVHFLAHGETCIRIVDDVVRFLQGRQPELAYRIATRGFLPEGPRFKPLDELDLDGDVSGPLAVVDRAKFLASLLLDDLSDMIRDGLDPRFSFSRYAEKLGVSLPTFAPAARALKDAPTLVTGELDACVDALIGRHAPALVALTVPFPGCLLGALLIARRIRTLAPGTRIVLGGGYVNTELRELTDPAIFDWVDYICLDDGEAPLARLAEHVCRGKPFQPLRTYVREAQQVVYHAGEATSAGHDDTPAQHPDFKSLDLTRYLSLVESVNPMHRLWSDGCWLKVRLAHGCYWRKCRFCDTSVDYIARYAAPDPEAAAGHLAALRQETGRTAFHFTDEALAPAWIAKVAESLIARGENLTWWGNIRFEKAFTPALARTLAAAGCVAVTGGLECGNDRLLKLINKGITLQQAATCCEAFAEAGILVHAYLIYGFPTQTAAETLAALEFIRGLFQRGVLHSAFWHRFALTCHSPMAKDPEAFGIRLLPEPAHRARFARNEIPYEEKGAPDPAALGEGLRRATYNYMLGRGFDIPVKRWFR